MIGDITQQNLYLIIPSKVSRIADILTTKEKENISLIDAIKKVYASSTYKKLSQESTKMWHESPVDLYYDIVKESARQH